MGTMGCEQQVPLLALAPLLLLLTASFSVHGAAAHALQQQQRQAQPVVVTARLLSERVDSTSPDSSTFIASYESKLFGGTVTVVATNSSVSFKTAAPEGLRTSSSTFIEGPVYEYYAVPQAAANLTAIDHIKVFYNTKGAIPYPTGQYNFAENQTVKISPSCLSCIFYITFFFIPSNESDSIGSDCTPTANIFCDPSKPAPIFTSPSAEYLPRSFTTSVGDVYGDTIAISQTKVPDPQVTKSITPLAAPQVGQMWVNNIEPSGGLPTFTYKGEVVLGSQNYYVSNNGKVVGVGQVVGSTYFNFFANFFSGEAEQNQVVETSWPFGVPESFYMTDYYPAGARSQVAGFQGTATFSFEFNNMTWRNGTAAPPKPASGLKLTLIAHLPLLMASVWFAGALVLLLDMH